MTNFQIEIPFRAYFLNKKNWIPVQNWAFLIFCFGFLAPLSKEVFLLTLWIWTFSAFWGIVAFGFDAFFESFSRKRVLIFLTVQGVGWLYAYFREYVGLGFNFYDTGIFSNAISNFNSGHGFFSSEFQINELSDHFCPNLILLSPIYKWWNSPLVLILSRFIGYLFSFYTLDRLCRLMKASEGKTSFILFLWAVNVGVNNFMDFEFQPSTLLVPFIFLLFELAHRQKFVLFSLIGLFIFGFKENAGLVIASIGVYRILYFKEWTFGTILIVSSALLTLLVVTVLTPYFGSGPSINASVLNPFCCPKESVKFAILLLLCSGGFLFFQWRAILVMVPAMALSLLTDRPGVFTLSFHYHDIPVAVSFALLVHHLSKLDFPDFPVFPKMVFPIALLIFLGSFSQNKNSSLKKAFSYTQSQEKQEVIEATDRFRTWHSKLPQAQKGSVWAQDCLAFFLSDLFEIHSLKNIQQTLGVPGKKYLIISDVAENRWPIEAEYDWLKEYLGDQIAVGNWSIHPEFSPLKVYEWHKNNPQP